MKIVVTGSNGFIGSNLIPTLKMRGHEIIELDFLTGVDIINWDSIKNINGFDVIIHLAAISYVPKSYEIPREMYKVNVEGTLNMLELSRINNAKLFFTSSYVYGKPKYLPMDENHPTSAFNPYCRSKLIGEDLCKGYNKDFGVPVVIFRPFNIYGRGQNENFLIPLIIKQIKEAGKVSLKDSRPKRDFVFINDVVDAYCKALEYYSCGCEIFNIGYGKSYSIKQVTGIIAANYPKEIPIDFTHETRKDEILDTVANISKAQTILNWGPKYSLEAGIKNLINIQLPCHF